MQTFMFYAHGLHSSTAAVLDNKRLGKQRIETMQIMNALYDPNYGWQNHPAVRMWRGHEFALAVYQQAICYEWTRNRGYKDTCYDKTIDILTCIEDEVHYLDTADPDWFDDERVFKSHRANYNRKLFEKWQREHDVHDWDLWKPFFSDTGLFEGYYWPVAG